MVLASTDLHVATSKISSRMLKGQTDSLPCLSRYVSSTSNARGQRMSFGPVHNFLRVFFHQSPWWTSEMTVGSGPSAKGSEGWGKEIFSEFSPRRESLVRSS